MPESLLNQGDTENQKASGDVGKDLFDNQGTPEDKPQATQEDKSQGTPEDKAKDETSQVPEKYDLKVPEGFALDEAVSKEFTALAKESKLSQEQAQKFADLHAKLMKDASQRLVSQWEKTIEGWQAEAKADPEIGGANHEEKLATAKFGLKTFGTPELAQLMDDLFVGNHKEFIRLFYRLGKIAQDPKFVEAEGVGAPKSDAEVLYPGHKP